MPSHALLALPCPQISSFHQQQQYHIQSQFQHQNHSQSLSLHNPHHQHHEEQQAHACCSVSSSSGVFAQQYGSAFVRTRLKTGPSRFHKHAGPEASIPRFQRKLVGCVTERCCFSFGKVNLSLEVSYRGRNDVAVVTVVAFLDDDATMTEQAGSGFMLPTMKKEYGAFGGGATLQKSKLDFSQTTTKTAPQTEHGGGDGGIGKKNHHGGGDGGDDGGDDDSYFDDGDEEDDGDDGGMFGRRIAIPEVFDRKIVETVLKEWYKTMSDLPAGIKQAVELGLISSAQMVRFISMNARPTLARTVFRTLPASLSRAFLGRMIADPAFLYKVFLEQTATIGYGVWCEVRQRGERIKDEWDLAACNVLTLAACNLAIVWSLAPCRSYTSTYRFDLQNQLHKLPNNVFDKSYPFREYDMWKRVYSFIYKAGELCLAGSILGTIRAGISRGLSSRKQITEGKTSSLKESPLAYGASLGVCGNLRYQLVYGAERLMQQHFNQLGLVILCSTALRLFSIQLGLSSLGLDSQPIKDQEGNWQAYRRPSLPSIDSLREGLGSFQNQAEMFPKRKVKKRKVMAVH